jgi:hypothetical protein
MVEQLDSKNKGFINVAFSQCVNLISLLDKHIPNREFDFLLVCFFIYFRQLAYYFSSDSSPLVNHKDKFTPKEQNILEEMINLRDASGHLNSDLNWLSYNIMLIGGKNFKDNDVEIQFGKTKLLLLKEIIPLFKKIINILSNIPELSHFSRNPILNIYKQEIEISEKSLSEKLKDARKLLSDIDNSRFDFLR